MRHVYPKAKPTEEEQAKIDQLLIAHNYLPQKMEAEGEGRECIRSGQELNRARQGIPLLRSYWRIPGFRIRCQRAGGGFGNFPPPAKQSPAKDRRWHRSGYPAASEDVGWR